MRSIVLVTGVVSIFQVAASLAQQSPSPPNEPAHMVYVMTGCLERGSAATSVFKLTDATSVGQMPPTDPSNTEVADGTRSYEVLPVSSVSEQGINRETLESHVGSQVEVTVRPMEAPTTPSTATSTSTTTTAKVDQSTPRRYTVVKISKVAESCQLKQR